MTKAEASPLEWFENGGTRSLGSGLSHLAKSLLKNEKLNCFESKYLLRVLLHVKLRQRK